MNLYILLVGGIYIQLTSKYQSVVSALGLLIPLLGIAEYQIGDNLNWLFTGGLIFVNLISMLVRI